MKKSGSCLKVYLALILLIVLVAVFPYKEGFEVNNWLDLSSWFKKEETRDISGSEVKPNEYDMSGLSYKMNELSQDASYNDYKMA